MSHSYSSVFGPYISALLALKRASGYRYESAEYHLRRFDRYCSLHADSEGLSRNLVLGWAKSNEGEGPGAHRLRMSVVRELGKYMQSLGVSDAFVLPSHLHRKIDRHVPHFFTKEELARFFGACDTMNANNGWESRSSLH